MTNFETNFFEVLTREAVRFCSRTVVDFPIPLSVTIFNPKILGVLFLRIIARFEK